MALKLNETSEILGSSEIVFGELMSRDRLTTLLTQTSVLSET